MHELIKKFASDTSTVLDCCLDVINRQNAEIKKLKELSKTATAAPAAPAVQATPAEPVVADNKIELDADKLSKAASALHTLHGSPSSCTPEQVAEYWKANPSSMLSLIEKMANAAIEKAASEKRAEPAFGKLVEKRASEASAVEQRISGRDSAAEAFWNSL